MPALDLIENLTDVERVEYEAALEPAQIVANRLPFVRVVVHPYTGRGREERDDVFVAGRLSVEHRGLACRRIEASLGLPAILYFHGGRTHPDYGSGVFVLDDINVPYTATPLGLGSLGCPGYGGQHESRQCADPVAHEPLSVQRQFVDGSFWQREEWRASAASFLALYFRDDLAKYFAPGTAGKPDREDPDKLFGASRNEDWRTWTIEIQAYADVDLFELARQNKIRWWGINSELGDYMRYDSTGDLSDPLEHTFPLLRELPSDKYIFVSPVGGKDLLDEIDELVQIEAFL